MFVHIKNMCHMCQRRNIFSLYCSMPKERFWPHPTPSKSIMLVCKCQGTPLAPHPTGPKYTTPKRNGAESQPIARNIYIIHKLRIYEDKHIYQSTSINQPILSYLTYSCLFQFHLISSNLPSSNLSNLIYLSIYLFTYLSIHPSIHPFNLSNLSNLPVHLSIHPSIHLSRYLKM